MEKPVQMPRFFVACELKRKVPTFARRTLARASVGLVLLLSSSMVFAQEHAAEAAHEGATHSMGDLLVALAWPLANFAIFCGVLYYFLNGPIKGHLSTRNATIRKELVEAAALKASANAQLAAIEQKLQALPGELDALRARGQSEIAAEEQRIAAAAVTERERLLEQTRREIDLQVRLAKREILEHAADLSVQLATERLKHEITPADQARLVDQYLQQVKGEKA
jgi:F-type H+-transporting ATPase subunit b